MRNLVQFYKNMSTADKTKFFALAGITVFAAAGFIVWKLYQRKSISGYAQSFLGEEETNANKGFKNKDFEAKMRAAGWYAGAQWCSFFVKMVYEHCLDSQAKDLAHKLISGSTQQTFLNFQNSKNDVFEVSSKPKKDGIVIWQNLSNSTYGHTGIVISVSGDRFETIEGNSNASGSEGIVKHGKYSLSQEQAGNGRKLRGFINFK